MKPVWKIDNGEVVKITPLKVQHYPQRNVIHYEEIRPFTNFGEDGEVVEKGERLVKDRINQSHTFPTHDLAIDELVSRISSEMKLHSVALEKLWMKRHRVLNQRGKD